MDNNNNLNAAQEPKGRRRKWEAFEEEVLLSVLEDSVARKQRCDTSAFKQEVDGWRSKHFPLYDRFAYIFGKDRATGNVAETPIEMMEEQSHDQVGASDIGGENVVSSMNQQSQQSTPSENSQRKRKKAMRSSSDGTEAIISGLKEFYVGSGKGMQMVTEALVQGTADHSDIANKLGAMGLSPMDQIDALTLILEKPQNVGVFMAINSELKKVFVQRLLSDKANG